MPINATAVMSCKGLTCTRSVFWKTISATFRENINVLHARRRGGNHPVEAKPAKRQKRPLPSPDGSDMQAMLAQSNLQEATMPASNGCIAQPLRVVCTT
ncbi:hypothetical protein [Legionella septentrionalis]|uniref:hypothetical protein n=1 Tax=Legionella septentrionalis TaxID=2498109 RepID=UPI0013156BF8|nr:hypothetical protein [Legionella septentrionalis]